MNWEAIGATAELLGAVGVIATVVYLAIQIRLNTNQIHIAANASRAESEREVLEAWNTIMASVGENEQIADILGRGLADYYSLTQPERTVFFARIGRILNHHYTQIRMIENGLGDTDLLKAMEEVIRTVLKSPGGKQFWEDAGTLWVQNKEINRILSEPNDTKPWNEYSFWSRNDV